MKETKHTLKILSCNIRCFGAEDGRNSWRHRQDICAEVIRAQTPDIICFQEMWAEQFADLSAAFSGFASYGMTDEPLGHRRQNCIFYRADRYNLVCAGGYWLSQTPHVAGSKSWDSNDVRLANWIRLEEASTGSEFRIINTHLDHIGQQAREKQAQLIAEDTFAYPKDYPQVLTGDMNCDQSNPAITAFKAAGWRDTYGAIHGSEDPGHTFHAFHGAKHHSKIGKMDWIFARGAIEPSAAQVIKDSIRGHFPSDHYFVAATLKTWKQST